MAQLDKNSELQTEALQNLKEDILLRSDDDELDDSQEVNGNKSGSMLDIASTLKNVLDTSANSDNSPDSGSKSALVDSLTLAFTTTKATSPAIDGKIAELVDNMLIGGLSTETVKERVEK